MKRLINIETMYTRTRRCLTVFVPYWSDGDRLETYVHTRGVDFMYGFIYGFILYLTFSRDLVRPLIYDHTRT